MRALIIILFGLLFLGLGACSGAASNPADAGDGSPGDADGVDDAGDSNDSNGAGDPGDQSDGPDRDLPAACTRAFAASFESPLVVAPNRTLLEAFSPDCRTLLTVDAAENRLRISDLVDRATLELEAGVQWAEFTPDGSKVLFLTPDGNDFHLWVASGGNARRIASRVGIFTPSPDGRFVAFIADWDPQCIAGTLQLVSLDDPGAAPIEVALDAVGKPLFAREGERLVYLGRAIPQHFETPNIICDWFLTEIRAVPVPAGAPETLMGTGVVASSIWHSDSGEWVYAQTDYGCEAQSYDLTLFSLSASAGLDLARDVPLWFPVEFLEMPARSEVVHAGAYLGPGYQLMTTQVDGNGSVVQAQDLIPSPEYSLWHIPFRRVGDSTLLYLQAETLDVRAIDPASGNAWRVAPSVGGLYYEPSPDGRELLRLQAAGEAWDLLATPIAGGPSRTLRSAMSDFGPPQWAGGGARVLLQADPVGEAYPVYSLDATTGQATVLDSASDWMAVTLHPGGWLVAISRPAGTGVFRVP